MSQGDPTQTFIRMCFALAGAGVVMWGAQRVCGDKMSYESCLVNTKPTTTNTREKIKAACSAKYNPDGKGRKMNMYIMYGGFGIIVGSVIFLWLMNSFSNPY